MSWLLWNTGAAALLALLVALVSRVFRPRPAVAHLMWLLVLLKLASPPLLRVELPRFAAFEAPRVVDLGALLAGAQGARVPAGPDAGIPWGTLLLAGWLLGSAVFCGALLRGIFRMHRRLRLSDTPSEALLEDVRRVARRLGAPLPLVVCDRACGSPFVWSIGRARLVLPRALATMTARSRDALLTHELAHLRRGDHWVARLEALLAIALWWHPLFWLARDRMRQQAELACDAWVLWATPESRFAYADALIASLEPRPFAAALPVLAASTGTKAAFERRLTMILNENVPCRLSGRVLAPLCVLTLGLFAAPMLAQDEHGKDRRHEITVNGKQLSELTVRERHALLEALRGTEADEVAPQKPKARLRPRPEPRQERKVVPEDVDVGSVVKGSLREARVQIAENPDLQKLGIAEDVVELIDKIAESHGQWFDQHLRKTLEKALHGAGVDATREIRLEQDAHVPEFVDHLKKALHGLHDGKVVLHEIHDLHKLQDLHKLHDLHELHELHDLHKTIATSVHAALREATAEIANDPDLEKLGITKDVQELVSGLLDGEPRKDFSRSLGAIIQKSLRAALDGAKATGGAHEGADGAARDAHKEKPKARKGRSEH